MKKHLIAAAVAAAVAAPAMAQNVSVYGILDLGYSQRTVDAGAGNATGVDTKTKQIGGSAGLSSSRLGFRGTEDIGGGLKANFVLEMGVTSDNSSTPFSSTASGTRAAWAGLSGNFGEIRIGRQNTIGKDMNDGFTAFGGGASFTQGSAVHNVTGNSSQQESATAVSMTQSTDRHSNTLTYISPVMGGFKVTGQVFMENSDASNLDGKATTSANTATTGGQSTDGHALRLDYANGPLALAVASTRMNVRTEAVAQVNGTAGLCVFDAPTANDNVAPDADTGGGLRACAAGGVRISGSNGTAAVAAAENKIALTQVGGSYVFGPAKVFLAYANGKYEADGADEAKVRGTDIGVTYALTPAVTLLGSYGTGKTETAAGVETKVKGYMVQAHYALSKRTTAYGALFTNELKTEGATGTDDKTMMVGIRHAF